MQACVWPRSLVEPPTSCPRCEHAILGGKGGGGRPGSGGQPRAEGGYVPRVRMCYELRNEGTGGWGMLGGRRAVGSSGQRQSAAAAGGGRQQLGCAACSLVLRSQPQQLHQHRRVRLPRTAAGARSALPAGAAAICVGTETTARTAADSRSFKLTDTGNASISSSTGMHGDPSDSQHLPAVCATAAAGPVRNGLAPLEGCSDRRFIFSSRGIRGEGEGGRGCSPPVLNQQC